jgi:hypothetical protein
MVVQRVRARRGGSHGGGDSQGGEGGDDQKAVNL